MAGSPSKCGSEPCQDFESGPLGVISIIGPALLYPVIEFIISMTGLASRLSSIV